MRTISLRSAQLNNATLSTLRNGIHEISRRFDEAKCVRKPTKYQSPDLRRVWIMTNNDDPAPNSNEAEQIVQLVRDCADRGIEIEIWPMPKLDKTVKFDKKKFYHRIETQKNFDDYDDDDDDGGVDNNSDNSNTTGLDYSSLMKRVQTVYKKR